MALKKIKIEERSEVAATLQGVFDGANQLGSSWGSALRWFRDVTEVGPRSTELWAQLLREGIVEGYISEHLFVNNKKELYLLQVPDEFRDRVDYFAVAYWMCVVEPGSYVEVVKACGTIMLKEVSDATVETS
jgi:hypothetical protein